MRILWLTGAAVLAACGRSDPLPPEFCDEVVPAIELTGFVSPDDAKSYRMLPFEVAPGTGRLELSYQWTNRPGPPGTPASDTTLDLGLWDWRGYRTQEAFRGWGGSRQGRIDRNMPPIFVEAGRADRGFTPGPIEPGTWTVDLGIAAVHTQGADWRVRIRQCAVPREAAPASDPVDAAHVARAAPGWYHGDFHMHAYHSNPAAPGWEQFIAMARAASLDFLMVTEYVTGRHWETLGAVQRAHPDLLIWPGREIITYYGHVNTHGETPGFYEYRHGFEDVSLAGIQSAARAAGALFQVNHPTFFPPPAFASFCRGCYFELGDEINWSAVDTIEILTGPVLATARDVGGSFPGQIENPFLQTAIDLWEDLLREGHRITAVSGSDSKGVEPDESERRRVGYGSSATAVFAPALSRGALVDAIRAGHAYVRTRGVANSPELEFTARVGEQQAMFGDALVVGATDEVRLSTVVRKGAGQMLRYLRDGETFLEVPVTSDDFHHELGVTRGPSRSFWRIETYDEASRTAIGNPVYLEAE